MRVLVADDQAHVRSAIQVLLKQETDVTVVGEVGEAGELLAQLWATHPDLLLLDWELPGLTAMGSLTILRNRFPALMVVALSGQPEARQAALAAGVDAFVSKTDPPEQLLAVLHSEIQEDATMNQHSLTNNCDKESKEINDYEHLQT
jgi:DNA-binding NarL/FixJ family response regulator